MMTGINHYQNSLLCQSAFKYDGKLYSQFSFLCFRVKSPGLHSNWQHIVRNGTGQND